MLSEHQSEKVKQAQSLLSDVKAEIKQEDFYTAVLLGQAANNCKQALEKPLPDDFVIDKVTVKVKYELSTGEYILKILGWIAGTSLLTSALCACVSLTSFGISEFKVSSGIKTGVDYAAESRGFRGLCFATLSITLACGVLRSVIGDAVYRSDD